MGDKTNRHSTFIRLVDFLRPHWRTVLFGLSVLILTTLLELIPPLVQKHIIDNIINNPRLPVSGRIHSLVLVVGGLVLLYATVAGMNRTRAYVMHVLGEKFILDLRRRMYKHLQSLSLTYFETRQTGEIMSRVTNDSEVVEEFVIHAADILIADVLKIFVIAAILFSLSPSLAVASLIPVPVLAFVTFKYSRKVRRTWRSTRERLGDMNAKLQDNVSGIRVIKSFAQEDTEYNRFDEEATEFYGIRVNVIRLFTKFFPLTQLITNLGVVSMWAYGGWLVIHGQATFGTLIAFVGYISMFYQPINEIARFSDTIQRALAASDRIFELLDTDPDIADATDAKDMPIINGRVAFEDVHFSYTTGEEVLSGINIHAEPGQIVALVGRSGAGKTSIVNLIPRFYDPSSGRILIDGIDVRTVKQQSIRRQVGMVLQDTFLFNGTIRENILFGRMDATEEELLEASKAAYAHTFIEEMTQGYDTEIGERGVKLSGGQKQRISIARAILADPRILILDEATSAVDSESEYYIHQAMDRLMQGRTTFVIAHRLSTIKHANLIVTLDGGRIVEVGDHKTLLERDGVYSQMYSAQYRLDAEYP